MIFSLNDLFLSKTFIEAMSEAMIVVDQQGLIQIANYHAGELFGYSADEMIGISIENLIPISQRQRHQELRKEFILAPRARSMNLGKDFVSLRKDGSSFFADIALNPVETKTGPIVIASVRDITARVTARELLAEKIAQLEILHQIGISIASSRDVGDLLQFIVRQATGLLGAMSCSALMPDWETGELIFMASVDDLIGVRIPQGKGVVSRVLKAGQAEFVVDVSQDADYFPEIDLKTGVKTHSYLVVPLSTDGKTIGILTAINKKEGTFTQEDCDLYAMLANYAAISIEKERLYEQIHDHAEDLNRRIAQRTTALRASEAALKERNLELNRLFRASETLFFSGVPVVDEIGQIIVKTVLDVFGHSNCSLWMLHNDDQELEHIAGLGPFAAEISAADVRLEANHFAAAIRLGKSIRLPDVQHVPEYIPRWKDVDSELVIPLKIGKRIIGILDIQSEQRDAFNVNDERLLSIFVERAALILENARLFKEAQWLATTDSLTNINNRRRFFELGRIEIERARRYQHPISAIMIDIDHFKQINDTYGHALGDQVLYELAQGCRENIREFDIIGRYGGEEFSVLLPTTDLAEALATAERLRQWAVAQVFANLTETETVSVTISLGVAELSADISDLAVLLDRADSALYTAKQAGRNCVRANS